MPQKLAGPEVDGKQTLNDREIKIGMLKLLAVSTAILFSVFLAMEVLEDTPPTSSDSRLSHDPRGNAG